MKNFLKSNIYLLILSILTSISFLYNPIINDEIVKITYQGKVLETSIVAVAIYILYKNRYNATLRRKSFKIISLLFTLFLIFGYSIYNTSSFTLVFDNIQYIFINILKLITYYIFINLLLNIIYEYLIKIDLSKIKNNKLTKKFIKNPYKFTFITLLIFYSIYVIAYYPGVCGYDPSYQIKEVLGIPNFYSESAGITGTNLLTNYNPVLHTLLIGNIFKIGIMIGNHNIGIFIYTLIQVLFMIHVLSYTIKFLDKENVPTKLLLIILGIYIFIPIFPFYSISLFKDTYFALFFILYIIKLYELIKYDYNYKLLIQLILVSLGLCLTRNNGILTILLSLPFCFIIKKNRYYTTIGISSIITIYLIYNIIINICGVTPTSKREVLSIPFQQISNLVVKKEEIISMEDRQIINKIIDYNSIKEKYNMELSDPIKNTYKNNSTNEDLTNFLKVWLKYFKEEPRIYIEATFNNIYGYYYPNKQNWYFYHMKYDVLNNVGFDYHYNNLSVLRDILYGYGEVFSYIPILNLTVNVGFMSFIYIYLIGFLKENKNKKYILLLLPAFSIILSSTLGPINTYYRYVIPYSFSLPLLLGLIYKNRNK